MNKNQKRRRGVIASRIKLERAMINCGLKTQASLARAIAENEGTDPESPPRDMVNRVFRGIAVDPHTIERIANVLNTTGYSLYLTSDENVNSEQNGAEEALNSVNQENQSNFKIPLIASISIILLLTIYIAYLLTSKEDNTAKKILDALLPSDNAAIAIYISGESKEKHTDLLSNIAEQFDENTRFIFSKLPDIDPSVEPWHLTKKINVDNVLHLQVNEKENYTTLFIDLINETEKTSFYNVAYPSNEISILNDKITQDVASLLQSKLAPSNSATMNLDKAIVQSPKRDAVDAYVEGMILFNRPKKLKHMYQALANFYRATSHTNSYAEAYAGICRASVILYELKKENALLEEAADACESSFDLSPNNLEYIRSMGFYYLKQNDYETAIEYFSSALERNSVDVTSMIGFAESLLFLATQTADRQLFEEAIALMLDAQVAEPENWKAPYTLGRLYYFSGDIQNAIKVTNRSIDIEENYGTLTNLATMNFCHGDLNATLPLYQRAAAIEDAPVVTFYNLASSYSYFEQFDAAVSAMETFLRKATETEREISVTELLGAADTYKLAGQMDDANNLYKQAYSLAEKQKSEGATSSLNSLQLLFIEISLEDIREGIISTNTITNAKERITSIESGIVTPTGIVRLLFTNLLLDDIDSAKAQYNQLAPVCKGFAEAPAFDGFNIKEND